MTGKHNPAGKEGFSDLMELKRYIAIKNSQVNYYQATPLYRKNPDESYTMYKPAGMRIGKMRVAEGRMPQLYFDQKDRVMAVRELQREFHQHLERDIKKGNDQGVKDTVCRLVEETLAEPRTGTIEVLPDTVDRLIWGYSNRPELAKTLAEIAFKDYSTTVHSVNVMALTIGFCFHCKYSVPKTRMYALSALLHDVGKTELPESVLHVDRLLTDEEFEIFKQHTALGADIINGNNEINDPVVVRAAMEHHERLDGSGYPAGKRTLSPVGQLVGLVDCYELLTTEYRNYRAAERPINVLKLLKKEAEQKKFSQELLKQFSFSLVK
ncbi:MAG: hypothetical protein CSB33_03250 [Desulfobacterales bacterium]|nr:MAG: hypothetical protein CSB33_03250 [Desulfobacterales bacterium]